MIVTSPLYSLKAWKAISEEAVSAWCGVSGRTIFRRLGRYTLLEVPYAPSQARTALQQEGRSAFRLAVAAWQELSEEEKASWNWYQDERRRKPVMSGYNLYIHRFLLSGGAPAIPSGAGAEGWKEAPDEGGLMLGQRCLNERCLNEDV